MNGPRHFFMICQSDAAHLGQLRRGRSDSFQHFHECRSCSIDPSQLIQVNVAAPPLVWHFSDTRDGLTMPAHRAKSIPSRGRDFRFDPKRTLALAHKQPDML